MTPPAHIVEEPTPPPGWARTNAPMRIAIVGWARLANQGREGSGYNLAASVLASGLALSGHKVFSLSSGVRYNLRPGAHIRRGASWSGIDCFEAVNSPNLSPSIANFGNFAREMEAPAHTRLVLRWLDAHDVEIVHVHSLEGYGFDCIRAIRTSGRPVVVTLHNYAFVCPQVDLFHAESAVCADYEGGRRCATCVQSRPAPIEKLKRRTLQTVNAALGPRAAMLVRTGTKAALDRLKGTKSNGVLTPPPDPELAHGFDDARTPDHDGSIEHNLQPAPDEAIIEPGRMHADENERFLRADCHLTILAEAGRRRIAGVEALNQASLVTPPSDFLRRVHVAMGVDEARTRTVRLGQPHFDQIHRRARRSPYYRARPWRPEGDGPLRLAFFGTTRANKGLEVVVRAIESLEPDVRRRCQFQIHASGWDWPFRRRLARFPEVAYAGGYDIVQLIGAGGEYHVGILAHLWFENSPLVLLEHLHAGKFVIASRLGGVPEWIVQPGEDADHPLGNGLMFPGGHPDKLAAQIARIVRGEVILPSPAEVHAATPNLQSYPAHVAEVESIYRELLEDKRA